jgi:hypothetical protein
VRAEDPYVGDGHDLVSFPVGFCGAWIAAMLCGAWKFVALHPGLIDIFCVYVVVIVRRGVKMTLEDGHLAKKCRLQQLL